MNTKTTASTGTAPTRTAHTPAGHGPERHAIVADDGRHLAASWFEPPAGSARAVAVISSAAGAPRGFYRGFAQWLAEQGYAVLTYDYRGIAGSRRGDMRKEQATMADWALLDMSAALAAAQARRTTEALPLLLIGHSFGGNAIAFARGVEKADALLTVASQLGEPRLFPGVHRAVAEFFFRAWVPAVVGITGYLPGWALGPGAHALPAGVARQWAAWGRLRGWAVRRPRHAPAPRGVGPACARAPCGT
jgi:predicted alpha/beta hydrolase